MRDENTRPQPSAEPVAWLYSLGAQRVLLHEQLHRDGVLRGETGWTETPLYPASALEAARREALEQAAKAFEAEADTWKAWPEAGAAKRQGAKAIRALQENTNG